MPTSVAVFGYLLAFGAGISFVFQQAVNANLRISVNRRRANLLACPRRSDGLAVRVSDFWLSRASVRTDALGAWHHEDGYPHNGGGDHHRRWRGLARPRSLVLTLFERRRDSRKRGLKMSAQPGNDRDNGECNPRGDEAIFNGRSG